MSERTTYEIVIRGRASARLLRPLIDDFTVEHRDRGTTRFVGEVTDAAHLQGLHAHLASLNVEIISIAPLTGSSQQHTSSPQHTSSAHQPGSTQP